MLPVIALVSYTTMALLPVLAIVKVMKVAENATDYSINNTARHVALAPDELGDEVSREARNRYPLRADRRRAGGPHRTGGSSGSGPGDRDVLRLQRVARAAVVRVRLHADPRAPQGFGGESSRMVRNSRILAPRSSALLVLGGVAGARRRAPASPRTFPSPRLGAPLGRHRGPHPEGDAGPRRDRSLRGQGAALGSHGREAPEGGDSGARGAST